MNLSALFRGDQAILRGNFLLITISWIIMFTAQPIPDTYASLYYLSLGANEFTISLMAFVVHLQLPLSSSPADTWLISMAGDGLS
jgi:hypothetical protein